METHAVPLPNQNGTFSHLAVLHGIYLSGKQAEEKLRRKQIILNGQKKAMELAMHVRFLCLKFLMY